MNATLVPRVTTTIDPITQFADWSSSQKEAVLIRLIDEVRELNENAPLIPLDFGDGIDRGYLLSAEGMQGYFDLYGPKLTDEDRDRIGTAMTDTTPGCTLEELRDSMTAAQTARRQCQSEPISS